MGATGGGGSTASGVGPSVGGEASTFPKLELSTPTTGGGGVDGDVGGVLGAGAGWAAEVGAGAFVAGAGVELMG